MARTAKSQGLTEAFTTQGCTGHSTPHRESSTTGWADTPTSHDQRTSLATTPPVNQTMIEAAGSKADYWLATSYPLASYQLITSQLDQLITTWPLAGQLDSGL